MSILAGWLVLLTAFPIDPPFCGIAASGAQMCGDSESEYVLKGSHGFPSDPRHQFKNRLALEKTVLPIGCAFLRSWQNRTPENGQLCSASYPGIFLVTRSSFLH